MLKNRKFFIHGGSSLISKFLVEKFIDEFDELFIFCRDISKTKKIINIEKFSNKKFIFFENNLVDLETTINDLNKLPDDLCGIFWVTGITGDPFNEYNNLNHAKQNLEINFLNPVLSISLLSKKIIKNGKSFICVFTSVAGLRGRKKRLYYSSAKSGLITFLSGLRQKFDNQIKVFTVIPGYISTNTFSEKASKILITSPKRCAEIVYNDIKKNKQIIYVNFLWRIIMTVINFIPEKFFKKLKF